MRPLAEFTASFGFEVSGSDRSTFGHTSKIKSCLEGTAQEQALLKSAKTVVFSSAISAGHPSLDFVKGLGITSLHRSELLACFTKYYLTVAIAGTHGKTTTSALVAQCLRNLGADPSWIIGAPFSDGQDSWRRGHSNILVIEADESDGSFLRYSRFISVLNNIEADHMDYYLTVDRLEAAFSSFLTGTASDGGICYFGDMPPVVEAASTYSGKKLSFGSSSPCLLRLKSLLAKGLSTTAMIEHTGQLITIELPLPGQHNVYNALASISVASLLGFDLTAAAKALSTFPGVQRRLQRYPGQGPALIFDDYAHNPGKISSCLAGLAAAYPDKSLIVTFQPHRFSRISSLYDEFVKAFHGQNTTVIVLPVYAAGEASMDGFEPEKVARDIANSSGVKSFSATTLKGACELIKSIMNPDRDIVVTVGAGDVWRVAEELSRHC